MNTTTNFIKEVKARLKGDEAGVIAAKVERKALSAINGQLAALKAKLVDDETRVEDAEEALATVIFPTSVFTDNNEYVRSIQLAQEKLNDAKTSLESTKDTIEYFENLLIERFK